MFHLCVDIICQSHGKTSGTRVAHVTAWICVGRGESAKYGVRNVLTIRSCMIILLQFYNINGWVAVGILWNKKIFFLSDIRAVWISVPTSSLQIIANVSQPTLFQGYSFFTGFMAPRPGVAWTFQAERAPHALSTLSFVFLLPTAPLRRHSATQQAFLH